MSYHQSHLSGIINLAQNKVYTRFSYANNTEVSKDNGDLKALQFCKQKLCCIKAASSSSESIINK